MSFQEGSIQLELPESPFQKGPGSRAVGFYNKSQKLNRDITISFLNTIRPRLVLDGFGGSGVRGLRIAKELGLKVVISEVNAKSFDYIRLNSEKNNVQVELYNRSFEETVDRFVFDYIDVDPYGSVIPYVDRAITRVRSGGYIGVTATDLSALTGSVPGKTRRRYDAFIANDSERHEMGIRLLIAYVVRRAAAFDRAALPVLSFWYSHYYRIIFRIFSGSGRADQALGNIGFMNRRNIISEIYPDIDEGPVWTGNLNSKEMLEKLKIPENIRNEPDVIRYTSLLRNEDISPLFVDVTDLARFYRKDLPPMDETISRIALKEGFEVGRTHFSPTGLKISSYDLDLREIFAK